MTKGNMPTARELADQLRGMIGHPTDRRSVGMIDGPRGPDGYFGHRILYDELPGVTHLSLTRRRNGERYAEWICPTHLFQHVYPSARSMLAALDWIAAHPGMPLPHSLRPGARDKPQQALVF